MTDEPCTCQKIISIVVLIIAIIIGTLYELDYIPKSLYSQKNNKENNEIEKNITENYEINSTIINDTKMNLSEIYAIIGIDFGSTFSGYCIYFDSIEELKEKNGLVPSKLLLDKGSKTALFIGKEAESNFKGDPNNKYHLYFTRFKMNLDPNIKKNMVNSDFPGDEIELKIIIKEFLRKMREEVENNWERIDKAELKELKWIITVPPLWDTEGKKLMQEAAKKAGMANLDVALEPEAASLSIFQEEDETIKKFNKKGTKFLIVDAGGYTVDFSANKILEDDNLEQLMIPMSIVNGSSLINNKIFDIYKKFVGEEKIKNANYSDIISILEIIEENKKNLDFNDAENLKLSIIKFNIKLECQGWLSFFKKLLSRLPIFSLFISSPPDYCTKEIDGKQLNYTKEYLFIPNKYITDIIVQTSKTIDGRISDVLRKIGSVNLTVFTGGFSQNKIFRDYMNSKKGENNDEIVFLKEPQMTVMKWAALFGLKRSQIVKRIIPITIGVESYEEKQDDKKCNDEYFDEKNNVTRCHEYLIYAKKRESKDSNEIINKRIHIMNERIIIYYNYEDEINDANKIELGSIEVLSENKDVNLTMTFRNFINVTIIDEESDEQNSVLLSYPVNKFF